MCKWVVLIRFPKLRSTIKRYPLTIERKLIYLEWLVWYHNLTLFAHRSGRLPGACVFSRDTTLLFHGPPDVCEGLLPQIVVKLAMKQISWEKKWYIMSSWANVRFCGRFVASAIIPPPEYSQYIITREGLIEPISTSVNNPVFIDLWIGRLKKHHLVYPISIRNNHH